MTKYTHQDVLDAALLEIADNCNSMVAMSAYPAPPAYAEVGALTLATASMTPGTSGDFALSEAGGTSPEVNRKVTVAARNDIDISAGGTATQVALLDTGSSKILHIADCTALQLVSGQKVNFPEWDITFNQPT